MKNIKRILTLFFVIFLMLVVFRGRLYNSLISYHTVGERGVYLIQDSLLKNLIDQEIKVTFKINQVVDFTNEFVAKQLTFSSTQNTINPNIFLKLKRHIV